MALHYKASHVRSRSPCVTGLFLFLNPWRSQHLQLQSDTESGHADDHRYVAAAVAQRLHFHSVAMRRTLRLSALIVLLPSSCAPTIAAATAACHMHASAWPPDAESPPCSCCRWNSSVQVFFLMARPWPSGCRCVHHASSVCHNNVASTALLLLLSRVGIVPHAEHCNPRDLALHE